MRVLITGANKGLGLGFVRHYLNKKAQVWACYRHEHAALQQLKAMHPKTLHLVRWDIATDNKPEGDLPGALDILINNAGVYGSGKGGQSLDQINSEQMQHVFNVDCIGPLRVVQRLYRHIKHGGVIANISSKMGSTSDNHSGGTYAYRAAKAALVIVSKSMAVDLAERGIHVITLHPGWVQTDMTGHSGLINVNTSVKGMAHNIEHARDYDAGSFIAYDGTIVPY